MDSTTEAPLRVLAESNRHDADGRSAGTLGKFQGSANAVSFVSHAQIFHVYSTDNVSNRLCALEQFPAEN